MSWIEKIKQDFIIKTGDDKEYKPLWFDANYVVSYNVSEFDFINVTGTLVVRRKPRGRVFDTEIRFQGDDCLEVSDAFKKSADAAKAWTISHPLYGTILVQPATLKFDNKNNNVVKINALLLETTGTPAKIAVSPADKIIEEGKLDIDGARAQYVEDVPVMPLSDIQKLRQTINDTYAEVKGRIAAVQSNVDDYKTAYERANTDLNVAIFQLTDVIESADAFLATPYIFVNTLQGRLDMFKVQLAIIEGDLFINLDKATPSRKRLYEHNAAVTITAICMSTVTNIGADYDYSVNVLGFVQQIIATYNNYLTNLCALQTDNNGSTDSYIPDANVITNLSQLVYTTTANLYALATQALQQRTYLVPYDTNLIEIAWLLYGMEQDDSTLFKLITTNNLVLSDHLVIQKGRELVYYV